MQTIADTLGRGRQTTQGSQTAYIVGTGTLLGSVIATIQQAFVNPKLAAGIALGVGATGAGVKGITSKVGREFLTEGFPRAGKVAERLVQPATQLGLQEATK